MKHNLLRYLRCPSCHGAISISDVTGDDGEELIEGELSCNSCSMRFSIVRGVPRFANLSQIESDKAATAANFGWSWQHFSHHDERYTEQFLGWIGPVEPEFFVGKLVLEGGCGKGRHTQLPAAVVYAATKLLYGPLNKTTGGARVAQYLFYNEYLKAIAGFNWREQHAIVFDHLVAPTAFYLKRAEFEEWWKDIGARDVQI